MIRLLCSFALLLALTSTTSATTVKVTFDRQGVPVPHWSFTVTGDGAGTYTSDPVGVERYGRKFQLAPASWAKMQKLLADSHGLAPCETKAKNLAKVGQKTVEYTPADGPAVTCSFNYTDNKNLAAAGAMFTALAATLDEGRRIEFLRRHDRLGLEKETLDYEHSLHEGFAIEPQLISTELQALVEDETVLERVRVRALRLIRSSQTK